MVNYIYKTENKMIMVFIVQGSNAILFLFIKGFGPWYRELLYADIFSALSKVTILKVRKKIFLEKKLHGYSPNAHINVSVSD